MAYTKENTRTPFTMAEYRMAREFQQEMDPHGLKVRTNSHGSMYDDKHNPWTILQTEPEPLKRNKKKVEALRAAGYNVMCYAPCGWGKRRAYVVQVERQLKITEADEAEAESTGWKKPAEHRTLKWEKDKAMNSWRSDDGEWSIVRCIIPGKQYGLARKSKATGNFVTDSWHETVAQAKKEAERRARQ